jgi:hypothetical protein
METYINKKEYDKLNERHQELKLWYNQLVADYSELKMECSKKKRVDWDNILNKIIPILLYIILIYYLYDSINK